MELTLKQKAAFGIGAVGKDMVYALSASYVMYYYQDVLGLSASFVGVEMCIRDRACALSRCRDPTATSCSPSAPICSTVDANFFGNGAGG